MDEDFNVDNALDSILSEPKPEQRAKPKQAKKPVLPDTVVDNTVKDDKPESQGVDCRKCIHYILNNCAATAGLGDDLSIITKGFTVPFCGARPSKNENGKRYNPKINCIGKSFKAIK